MGNNHPKIKAVLILETDKEDLFDTLCKYIHEFTNDVECLYFVNKNYILTRSSFHGKIYKSYVKFNINKFKSLIFIWKTLCTWKKVSDKYINFEIYGERKNLSYLEFRNDNFNRYDYSRKPSHIKFYFENVEIIKKKNNL